LKENVARFTGPLTRQSFLMQTELPTLLNVFETLNFNTVKTTLPADKNKHK